MRAFQSPAGSVEDGYAVLGAMQWHDGARTFHDDRAPDAGVSRFLRIWTQTDCPECSFVELLPARERRQNSPRKYTFVLYRKSLRERLFPADTRLTQWVME
jgi:hypothetical protein